jgi:hypothetical protein
LGYFYAIGTYILNRRSPYSTRDERKIFSGSSGQIISVPEAGSINRGRQNWEQIR